MNDLLFTALTIATLYYFLVYLPEQKKLTFSESKAVQTETIEDKELDELKTKNQELATELQTKENSYQQKVREKDQQITKLQTEIRELVKRPLKPTNSKGIQTDPETELTNTLDTLIKDIQEFNLKI